MNVRVYYLPSGRMPSSVETLSTPLDDGWARCRLRFGRAEDGKWGLFVEAHVKSSARDRNRSWEHRMMLTHECGSIEEYVSWLESRVAYIESDGVVFWSNQSLSEEER